MAKSQKIAKTTTKSTKQTGTRGTILGLPIEDQLITREISRTTKHAAKAPKTKETAKKVEKKALRQHGGFRVFILDRKSWEVCKSLAQKQETNTHTLVNKAIEENLPGIVEELKKAGITKGDKRVRMERPAKALWDSLLKASEEVTLPAQTLLVMTMMRAFGK